MSAMPSPEGGRAGSADLYRSVLAKYSAPVLRGVRDRLDLSAPGQSATQLVKAIEEHLCDPSHRTAAVSDLAPELRPALAVLPHMPQAGWRADELREVLRYLGCRTPDKAIRALLALGLIALDAPTRRVQTVQQFDQLLAEWGGESLLLVPHPAFTHQSVGIVEDPPRRGLTRSVRGARESDGRELLLRAAVLWQRIAESPLRLTQDGELFKRDLERLAADAVLGAPVFDELAPLPDMSQLALALAESLGLIERDEDSAQLRARLTAVWQESLPAMQRRVWQTLLATRRWNEMGGDETADPLEVRHLPARRWATLLLLAALDPDTWIDLDSLDRELSLRNPDRASLGTPRGPRPFRVFMGRSNDPAGPAAPRSDTAEWLETFLLGAMYQAGITQVADEAAAGSPVVRLAPLGRWILGVGPLPLAPPLFDKTLFVQPNHEVVVYRQGLTPELLGQLASFCRWKGLGAALTLELTAESVYRGLELGRTAEEMVGILDRHSQRSIPPGVADSVRTWSQRRERLSFYTRSTILEFSDPADLEQALARGICGDRLTDRMLLVADERSLPFDQFRLAGSRDYRQPPAVCVVPAEDGVTLEIDAARSDLLVEREVDRFADPLPGSGNGDRRRYRVTPASLARAARLGLRPAYLAEWFRLRAGRGLPSSVQLMLQATSRAPIRMAHTVVLEVPSEAVADGIMQHPLTRPHIASRLGPTALAVAPDKIEACERAFRELGINITPGTAG